MSAWTSPDRVQELLTEGERLMASLEPWVESDAPAYDAEMAAAMSRLSQICDEIDALDAGDEIDKILARVSRDGA